jgi:hypothetical protein
VGFEYRVLVCDPVLGDLLFGILDIYYDGQS